MQKGVLELLRQAGVRIRVGERSYRPSLDLPDVDAKLLKHQNVIEMLQMGSRDLGFAGADWVREMGADLVELLDTGLDPVRLVAAAPPGWRPEAGRRVVVASEYAVATRDWIGSQSFSARFIRSYGATEAFPPEDADVIVDNTATGTTLRGNGLVVLDELARSSTRLYANPDALKDPRKGKRLEDFALLIGSALEARARVMLEVNVSLEDLDGVVAALPAMREPTVARLHQGGGYAVRAAVPRKGLPELILRIRRKGGSDLVVTQPVQIAR